MSDNSTHCPPGISVNTEIPLQPVSMGIDGACCPETLHGMVFPARGFNRSQKCFSDRKRALSGGGRGIPQMSLLGTIDTNPTGPLRPPNSKSKKWLTPFHIPQITACTHSNKYSHAYMDVCKTYICTYVYVY